LYSNKEEDGCGVRVKRKGEQTRKQKRKGEHCEAWEGLDR